MGRAFNAPCGTRRTRLERAERARRGQVRAVPGALRTRYCRAAGTRRTPRAQAFAARRTRAAPAARRYIYGTYIYITWMYMDRYMGIWNMLSYMPLLCCSLRWVWVGCRVCWAHGLQGGFLCLLCLLEFLHIYMEVCIYIYITGSVFFCLEFLPACTAAFHFSVSAAFILFPGDGLWSFLCHCIGVECCFSVLFSGRLPGGSAGPAVFLLYLRFSGGRYLFWALPACCSGGALGTCWVSL